MIKNTDNQPPSGHSVANQTTVFDWSDLAFGSKRPLRDLRATFIAAPREISRLRFKQLVRTYLPKANIILGIAKEAFVDGFDGQPQFRTLGLPAVRPTIDKVNAASPKHKIYVLRYFQREADYIIEQASFKHVLLINGSWHYAFHNRSTFYSLQKQSISYEQLSPFASGQEAKDYEQRLWPEIVQASGLGPALSGGLHTAADMLQIAARAARRSYDYTYQTGVALGREAPNDDSYQLLASSFNKVVPYQTYALHHGASREQHFSPPDDLNHYDTVHAEVGLLIEAQRQRLDLHGTTVFINLLPCPACARMLSQTGITGLVYREDHSAGYAIRILELAGKTVRRIV